MEQDIAKKANSKELVTRKQALQSFLSLTNWCDKKELVILFLEDPSIEIRSLITEKVLGTCHHKFIPNLKLIASSSDVNLRTKILSVFSSSDKFFDLNFLLERLPLESQATQGLIRQGFLRILKAKPSEALCQSVQALASNNVSVRAESIKIFDIIEDKKAYAVELFRYLKSTSVDIKKRVYGVLDSKKEEFLSLAKELFKESKDLQILNFLSYFNDAELEDLLIKEIASDNWSLKLNSIQMLSKMKSEKAKPKLIQLLSSEQDKLEVISALRLYKDNEMGVAFLRMLGKSNHQEQLEILKGIKAVTTDDKRYVEPLLVFALHHISSVESKKSALKIALEICKNAQLEIPEKVQQIQDKIKEVELKDIPDLGLKLED